MLTYTVGDRMGGQAEGIVHILVLADTSAVYVLDDSMSVASVVPVTLMVLKNDDGVALVISQVDTSILGSVTVAPGDTTLSYTAFPHSQGSDSFRYTAVDASGDTASAWVTLAVDVPNHLPVAVEDRVATTSGELVKIGVLANDLDADGDSLRVTDLSSSDPDAVVTADNNGLVHYQSAPEFVGEDRVLYTIGDGYGGASAASVVIVVTRPNSAPLVLSYQIETTVDGVVTLDLLGDSQDAEGDSLQLTEVTEPEHGSISLRENGRVDYMPEAGYTGNDAFDFTVVDIYGAQASNTVTVAVNPEPDQGDFDGDNFVGFADFVKFIYYFGFRVGDVMYRALYDLNKDGVIDLGDFLLFVEAFGAPT